MTFATEDEMKWCTYTLETSPAVQAKFHNLRVFAYDHGSLRSLEQLKSVGLVYVILEKFTFFDF